MLMAAEKGHANCITSLHDTYGMDCNAVDEYGCNVLSIAVQSGHTDCVTALYNAYGDEIDVNAVDYENETPLQSIHYNKTPLCCIKLCELYGILTLA